MLIVQQIADTTRMRYVLNQEAAKSIHFIFISYPHRSDHRKNNLFAIARQIIIFQKSEARTKQKRTNLLHHRIESRVTNK